MVMMMVMMPVDLCFPILAGVERTDLGVFDQGLFSLGSHEPTHRVFQIATAAKSIRF